MIKLPAERVALAMGISVGFLVLCSGIVRWLVIRTGHDNMLGLVQLFDLNQEMNLPTWYSSATLLLASIILAVIGTGEREALRSGRPWFGLAAIFAAMSVDEVASIHEISIAPIRETFGFGGMLYYAWVVPGAVLVLIVAIVYSSWFFRLPKRTRNLSLAAGVLFVGGAIGFELLGGLLASRSQQDTLIYAVTAMTEETLEMLGVLVWVYALLDYARLHGYELRVRFTGSPGQVADGSRARGLNAGVASQAKMASH